MDHANDPNASHTSDTVSWNPALRPDHEETPIAKPTPSEFESQEEAQPVVNSEPAVEEGAEPEAVPAASAIENANPNPFDFETTSGEDFFDKHDNNTPQHSSRPSEVEIQGNTAGASHEDALVNGLNNLALHAQPSDSAEQSTEDVPEATRTSAEEQPASAMSESQSGENYEHQGDDTILEEAMADDAYAPLINDSNEAAEDWGSEDVFDLGGKAQDADTITPQEDPLPTPTAEAVGTTVGDDVIGNTSVGGNTGEDIDWGNSGDSDLFGAQPPSGEDATGGASAWDLALDDDFLPDLELDDDGFLEDEPTEAPQPDQKPAAPANRYAPQATQPSVSQPAANAYSPQAPQFTDFSLLNKTPAASPSVGYGAFAQPSPYQQPPTRPAMTSSAESFAAKSKGGYHSPYDLPEDVVKTKRKPAPRPTLGPLGQPVQTSPRVPSAYSPLAPRPPPVSMASAPGLTPPSSSHSHQAAMSGMPPPAKPASASPSSDFFAELPITTKPKPSGRYTPQSSTVAHPPVPQGPPQVPPQGSRQMMPPQMPPQGPPQGTPKERTGSWSSLRNEVHPTDVIPPLQQPERLPVFPDQPSVPVRSNSLPVPSPAPAVPSRYSPQPPSALASPTVNARYSPQPPAAPVLPPANTRYSPAPPPPAAAPRFSPAPPQAPALNRYASEPAPGPPKHSPLPYAPRTSSPLVHHTPSHEEATPFTGQAPQHVPTHETHSDTHRPSYRMSLEGVREVDEQTQENGQAPSHPIGFRSETPPMRSGPSSVVGSPRKTSSYAPQYQPAPHAQQTGQGLSQSPESLTKQQSSRSFSSEKPALPYGATMPAVSPHSGLNVIPHKHQVSHDFEFIPPTDERSADPLERWKGYPIFRWGLGGTVVTSFPKQIPRYGGGASQPKLKCTPGEVKLPTVKEFLPLPEETVKFPGPLKAKSKKKDVSAWLGRGIEAVENQLKAPGFDHLMTPSDVKRLHEKVLLWKILQVMVDNDGVLEGNPTVEGAIRRILAPEGLISDSEPNASIPIAADLVGGMAKSQTTAQPEPIDPKAVEELRSLLTKGDREKAVWHAVDQRLWGHAMLLSSTLDKNVWRQVVQEFVQKEVKKAGPNNQALAVLYEIFAGNWEDCIDELVPASARAGFQMVSTDGAGAPQNALQGLEKWQETLSLVLNNRSAGDTAALLSLGRLLAGYGRPEAAHICFLFARPAVRLGGVDDAQSDIVLLGADHKVDPLALGNDVEPILLTEVYEFALSLSSQNNTHIIPHLQGYKLAHAYVLAENGHRTEAQAYCDAIAAAMKATTKISPYYNASFIASLDDLHKRLSQSPKDGSSSWISKPSMDKVSSSFLSKFNSFIAGDDDDAASNHSAAEVGPFARIAGNTPTISPSQSSADLYGAYAGYGAGAQPPAAANSRYAPRTSLDQSSQGRPSMDSQASNAYMPSPALASPYTPTQQFSPTSRPDVSKAQSYAPLKGTLGSPYGSPYQPSPLADDRSTSFGGYQPHHAVDAPPSTYTQQQPTSSYEPPKSSYEPPTSSYEPPTTSYEPPSYTPYQPDNENEDDKSTSSDSKPKPKKKSFMDDSDDEDDLARRAAALKSSAPSNPPPTTSNSARTHDDAFLAAVQADAAKDSKDSQSQQKKGWFGGWFKKGENSQQQQSSGPIKAKLGEENSFVYDPELKKWVNKKAGAANETAKSATPPPPRGPPGGVPRSVSEQVGAGGSTPPMAQGLAPPFGGAGAGGPPMRSSSMPPPMGGVQGPPTGSRASTPASATGEEGKAPTLARPPLMGANTTPGGSGPPSRPGTGMSNASSIDDLLGAPGARKGGAKKKRGGAGRYVDVMNSGM